MASEPKKPIEQMLEALAKARRAEFGDDAKMPNPMRARLHEEIARAEAAEDEGEARPSWLTMFWPRVTVAAALATLLVLVPAIWWNQSHPVAESRGLALRDHAAQASFEPNSDAPEKNALTKVPAISTPESTVNLADNSRVNVEPARPTSEAEVSKSEAHIAQGRAATELPSQETKGFEGEIASAKIQAAPAAAPPAGADSKAKLDAMAAAAPAVARPSRMAGTGRAHAGRDREDSRRAGGRTHARARLRDPALDGLGREEPALLALEPDRGQPAGGEGAGVDADPV